MAVVYLLTESGKNKAQHTFWKCINDCVYDSRLTIIPTNGVFNILPVLRGLKLAKDDVVLVNVDVPADNTIVLNEILRIQAYIKTHSCCYFIGETCFEDTLLQFRYFREWLYSTEYRKSVYLHSNEKLLLDEYLKYRTDWRLSSVLCSFISRFIVPTKATVEKLAYYVLHTLTYERGKLCIDKGNFGTCWYCDCKNKVECYRYYQKGGRFYVIPKSVDKECGLFRNKKDTTTKVQELFRYTILPSKLKRAKRTLLNRGYTVVSFL